jgi:ubiquitin carboxyl-terminal hydrolase 22/27/51
MGKGKKNAHAQNNKKNAAKPPPKSAPKSARYNQSCSHFKLIGETSVRQVFESPTFRKAVSGKALTQREVKEMTRLHPDVDWTSVRDLYLCLCCGRLVRGEVYTEHFTKSHCLALSFDDQTIECLKCGDFHPIQPRTLCAELLGIEELVTPLTVSLPSSSTRRIPREHTRGLVNLGNSCWLNALLQILIRLPVFFDRANGPLSAALADLQTQLTTNGKALEPTNFVVKLNDQFDFLDVEEQQDAYEFLILFLDALRDEQGGTSAGLTAADLEVVQSCLSTPLDRLFGFILRNTLTCDGCKAVDLSYVRSAVLSLFVPVGGGAVTLMDCLRLCFSDSSTNSKDDRRCEHCHEVTDCLICPSFLPDFMPLILIVHLSRFRVGKNGYVKNNIKVALPEVMDFQEDFGIPVRYQLLGFVSHYGSIDAGHYTSIMRDGDFHFIFDDEEVIPVDYEKARQLQGYLLFYQKMSPV